MTEICHLSQAWTEALRNWKEFHSIQLIQCDTQTEALMRVISMIDILTIPGHYGWYTQPYWKTGTNELNWNKFNSNHYDQKLNFPKLKLWCWWHSAAKTMLRSMKNRQMIEFRVKWRTHSNQGTNDDKSKKLPNHLLWRQNINVPKSWSSWPSIFIFIWQ